jgi:cobalt-zinc-cadmium efflux system protein
MVFSGHVHAGARAGTIAAHGHTSETRAQRLVAVMAVNAVVVVIELVGGLWGRSLALVADAGHNVTDIAALAVALLAVYLAKRPPTGAKSFGYHRSGVLAAQANAAGVLVVCAFIAAGAIDRLAHPQHVRGGIVFVTAVVALVLNGLSAWVLHEKDSKDLNIRATVVHMAGDAASAAGVAGVGLVAWLGATVTWLDPVVSLAIAALIGAQAVSLGRRVADVLLEGAPAGTDGPRLSQAVVALPGVDEMHDLHIWSLSSEVTLLSAHLVMAGHPTLEDAQAVAARVRALLAEQYGIAHATLELECETCAPEADPCAMASDGSGRSHPWPAEGQTA